MRTNRIDYQIGTLARALSTLADQLEPEDAAAAARTVVELMAKTGRLDRPAVLVASLSALARRLPQRDADALARAMVEAMAATTDPAALYLQAETLSALARRLERRAAAQHAAAAGRVVVGAMARNVNKDSFSRLEQAFSYYLVGWLEPEEAARQASEVARIIADALPKANPNQLRTLAVALLGLARRVGPREASATAVAVLDTMHKNTPSNELPYLARTVVELVGRLEPAEADRLTSGAVAVLSNMPSTIYQAEALGWLAPRLTPSQASIGADAALKCMAKPTDSTALSTTARAFLALASRLDGHEARRQTTAAANLLLGAMAETSNRYALSSQAQALSTLSGRLTPAEASGAIQLLFTKMSKTDNLDARYALSEAVAALADRLEAREAARQMQAAARLVVEAIEAKPNAGSFPAWRSSAWANRLEPAVASAAARAVLQAMAKTTDPQSLRDQAVFVAALAGRLEPSEAATHSTAAARLVLEFTAKTTSGIVQGEMCQTLGALAPWLQPAEALAAARTLLEAMPKNKNPALFASAAPLLSALAVAGRLDPPEAAERAARAARAVGEGSSPFTSLSGLAALVHAAEPLPSRFSTQELVDLLKMPTCVGPFREVILAHLGRRCHREFADLWEFVEYAEKHLPDIDLKSPAQAAGARTRPAVSDHDLCSTGAAR
jgi:hypothetical protein